MQGNATWSTSKPSLITTISYRVRHKGKIAVATQGPCIDMQEKQEAQLTRLI
jgi:hypothetical protein